MLKKTPYLLLTICFAVSNISCATIISGKHQKLPVSTSPSGAIVTIGTVKQEAPAVFILDRSESVYIVKIEKEGYESVEITLSRGMNGWFMGNILLGGIIGMVIDLSSGSSNKFAPDEIQVNLVKGGFGFNNLDLKDKDIIIVKLAGEE